MTRTLVVLACLVVPTIASAQEECAEGRVRGSEGFCCWPGQTFSTADRRCEGAPQCPEGLVEHGEACLSTVVPAPPSYARFEAPPPMIASDIAAPPARSTSGWPAQHEGQALSRAVPRHGEDGGLVAAAMVVFDVGWTFGMLVGILDATSANCFAFSSSSSAGPVNCGTWALAFIPVGGGIAAGTMNFVSAPTGFTSRNNATWGASFGSTSAVLQTAGLIMMAVALANEVHDVGTVPLGQGVSVAVFPGAPASDLGVSALLLF